MEPFWVVKCRAERCRLNGRGLDYYRYDGGDIKGTKNELIAAMESVLVEGFKL